MLRAPCYTVPEALVARLHWFLDLSVAVVSIQASLSMLG
jgi:hypothetical protein